MRIAILAALALFLVNVFEESDPYGQAPARSNAPVLADASIAEAIDVASIRYQLPEPLLRAIAEVSSGTDPDRVGSDGSMGLFMIHPREAAKVYELRGSTGPIGPEELGLSLAYKNAEIAGEYLAWLRSEAFGENVGPEVYVAALHAGPDAVQDCMNGARLAESCLDMATRRFVRRVKTRVPVDIWR